jgi:RND family efflux transporter MFP subunit
MNFGLRKINPDKVPTMQIKMMGPVPAMFGLLLMATLVSGCSEPVDAPEIVRPVRVMRVAAAQEIAGRSLPGRARATEETNLSFDVPGTILERPVSVGDQVESGQLLARLDQRDYKNQRDAAFASRNRMRANFERVEIAVESGAVSRQDLDDARAQLDVAQAQLNIAEKAIEDSEIHAPRAGTISATYVEVFTSVQAKEAVVRLLDTSAIEMVVQVPESLISYVPQVETISIEFDAFPGRPVSAEIKEISNEASQTTRTFPVTLIMEQPEDFKILPGMAGRATGSLPENIDASLRTLKVPLSAIFTPDEGEDLGASLVWVVDETSNTVAKRSITTGELDRFGIQVNDGIKTGDLLVISGVNFLKEGQKVRTIQVGSGT